MNQGFLNWLNAVNHDEKNSEQTKTGLLLAPIDSIQQNNLEIVNLIHEINEPIHIETHEPELEIPELEIPELEIPELEIPEPEIPEPEIPEPEIPEPEPPELKYESQESEPEYEPEPEPHEREPEQQEPERIHEPQEQPQENESQELNTLIGIPDDIDKNNSLTEAEAITRELQSLKNEVDSIHEKTRGLDLNKAWHEANAGLELSMKEPPPQIWASRNESESEDENENDSDEYEHVILQQNSSVVLHGTNFTQRLQNILQGRKSKAAELKRKNSEENKHSHSYLIHAIIMCALMLLALGLAYLSLRYLQTKTPESFNMRASELYENGKYEEAMNLYQEAYNRYPNVLTFLTGIARSAEKAGHSQTANIAWNEYRNTLPKDASTDIEIETPNETLPMEININTGGDKRESRTESREQENATMLTFNEYLNEANRSFNIGMYNRALLNFFHALERRSDDIRPYIGIAESYRAKGMYFDANRILDEARKRFGINPSIEAAKEFLKGSN